MGSRITLNLIGNVILAASRWAIYVLVVKLVDFPAVERDVADLTIAAAICGPAFIFFGGGLRQIVAVQVRTREEWIRVLAARFILGSVAIGVCFCAGMLWRLENVTGVLCGVAATRFADGMSEVVYAMLQGKESFGPIALFKIARGGSNAVVVWCALYGGQSLAIALCLGAVAWWVQFLLVELPYALRRLRAGEVTVSGERHDGTMLETKKLCFEGFLLSTAMSLAAVSSVLPSYILGWRGDDRLLAVYGSLYCLVAAQQMVYVSWGQCLVPRLASMFELGRGPEIRRSLALAMVSVMGLAVIGAIVVAVLGAALLREIYHEEFSNYADGLAALLLAGGLTGVYAIAGSALTSARIYSLQIAVSLVHIFTQCLILFSFGEHLTLVQIGCGQGVAAIAAMLVMRLLAISAAKSQRMRQYAEGLPSVGLRAA